MLRTFRFQLRPTRHQAQTLTEWLAVSCEPYNAALEVRREAWKVARQRITYEDQTAELTELRELCPEDIAREPLRRIDRAFQAFFQRCKAGGRPGYPRFRSRERYDSLAFSAVAVEGNSVRVPKLGGVRLRKHREMKGRPKTCILHRAPGGQKWSVSVSCDLGPAPEKLPVSTAVGVDMRLAAFVTLSEGRAIEKPNWARGSGSEDRCGQSICRPQATRVKEPDEGSNRAPEGVPAGREPAPEFLPSCVEVSGFDLRPDQF